MDIWIYDQFLHTIYHGYITGNGTSPTDLTGFFGWLAAGLRWNLPAAWLPSLQLHLLAALLGVLQRRREGCFAQHFWWNLRWRMIVSFWKWWIDMNRLNRLYTFYFIHLVLQCIRCRNHEQLGLCISWTGAPTAHGLGAWVTTEKINTRYSHYGDTVTSSVSISEVKKSPMMGWNSMGQCAQW